MADESVEKSEQNAKRAAAKARAVERAAAKKAAAEADAGQDEGADQETGGKSHGEEEREEELSIDSDSEGAGEEGRHQEEEEGRVDATPPKKVVKWYALPDEESSEYDGEFYLDVASTDAGPRSPRESELYLHGAWRPAGAPPAMRDGQASPADVAAAAGWARSPGGAVQA